jgi:hypothetical protein
MCMSYKTKLYFIIQKKKPKVVSKFWYDSKFYEIFSRWNAKSCKIYTLWKFYFYSIMINKKMWYIGAAICIFNNKWKIFHSKILSYKKIKKDLKGSTVLLKIILLVPLIVSAPNHINHMFHIWMKLYMLISISSIICN